MGWVLPALSFGFQAFSAIRGFQAEKKAAKATERANAAAMAQAEEQARLAREDAAFAADKERENAKRVRSQQIAQFMKSGVTLEGTPLLVLDETSQQGEENAQNTIDNAESRARSMILQGQANQRPVQKPDLFGTGATILGAGMKAFE